LHFFRRNFKLHIDNLLEARFFYFERDLILHLCRRRSFSRIVIVHKRVFVAHRPHQIERFFEIFVRLSRKAEHNVRRKRYVGKRGPYAADKRKVLLARIAPVHRLQYLRRTVLHRQMDVAAQHIVVFDRVDKGIAQIFRMTRNEAHPFYRRIVFFKMIGNNN